MATYSVYGKLGTGKTKFAVFMAREALREGRRVASNVDLDVGKLTPGRRSFYVRIPDKPRAFDLEAMGHGNPHSMNEDRNGVLILDELGTWLNARSFQDRERAAVLDWLIHARKLGWDVFFLVQDAVMIDKQVREALIEYQARCMRMDKVRIPFVGAFLRGLGELVGLFLPPVKPTADDLEDFAEGGLIDPPPSLSRCRRWGYLPRFHLVVARIGEGSNAVVARRWTFRGDDLHEAYDTRQVFRADYPHGAHCVLPAWDFKPPTRWLDRFKPAPRVRPVRKPKARLVEVAQGLPAAEAWAVLAAHWRRADGRR